MAVFGLVSSVAGFIKVRYLVDKAVIDNMVFRCHYRLTSAVLFLCCVLVTANNLIGDPINCINDGSIANHVINTYCWITYTFTLPGYHGRAVGTAVASSGLGNEHNQERTYHSYYQWVPFMLFFQGLLFYMPHWIWKNWEENKIRMISEGLRGATTMGSTERKLREDRLARYLFASKKTHNSYSFGYFLCEALNFVNVIGNIFFVDKFLGGAFLTYGSDVLRFSDMDQENRSDPMIEVFPRVTKCTFHKYGASGSIQKHDALCVLALNILNEKIYIFLWFWFIILSVLSGLAILYSAAILMMPTSREKILQRRLPSAKKDQLEFLINNLQIGDFLMVHLLSQNINVTSFGVVVDSLRMMLEDKRNRGQSTPSAPSTLEMAPIYPELGPYDKEKAALQEYEA